MSQPGIRTFFLLSNLRNRLCRAPHKVVNCSQVCVVRRSIFSLKCNVRYRSQIHIHNQSSNLAIMSSDLRLEDEGDFKRPPERTDDEAIALFREIEASFPEGLGQSSWYLLVIATLTPASNPEFIATLYTYLISKPEYTTSESRQALIRRIREALVKLVSIIGVVKPLEAIFAIDAIEREEDKDFSCSRDGWQVDEHSQKRGRDFLNKLYRGNIKVAEDRFRAHKDFGWISYNITYGLYLSDQTILDEFDTEIVVLCGIMIQNVKLETHWHLRGARRLGMSMVDVEAVHVCCEKVAKFCRIKLDNVPRVADIEHEVPWTDEAKA